MHLYCRCFHKQSFSVLLWIIVIVSFLGHSKIWIPVSFYCIAIIWISIFSDSSLLAFDALLSLLFFIQCCWDWVNLHICLQQYFNAREFIVEPLSSVGHSAFLHYNASHSSDDEVQFVKADVAVCGEMCWTVRVTWIPATLKTTTQYLIVCYLLIIVTQYATRKYIVL